MKKHPPNPRLRPPPFWIPIDKDGDAWLDGGAPFLTLSECNKFIRSRNWGDLAPRPIKYLPAINKIAKTGHKMS